METSDPFEDKFPVNLNSRFINFLQQVILYSVKLLALLMTIVIIWSVFDVGYSMTEKMMVYPHIINMDDILGLFGGFLVVLIAIEIFLNIILYLRKDKSHTKLVIATALMAIARKVIILDYEHVEPYQLVGLGAVILALGITYWLVRPAPQDPKILTNVKATVS